jgi:ferric-dicitrate binding protein FerR (iron transport regulator)
MDSLEVEDNTFGQLFLVNALAPYTDVTCTEEQLQCFQAHAQAELNVVAEGGQVIFEEGTHEPNAVEDACPVDDTGARVKVVLVTHVKAAIAASLEAALAGEAAHVEASESPMVIDIDEGAVAVTRPDTVVVDAGAHVEAAIAADGLHQHRRSPHSSTLFFSTTCF